MGKRRLQINWMYATYKGPTTRLHCLYRISRIMDALRLEERIAHLTRAVDDLSDVVARQARELDRLTRLVGLLTEREAERETQGGAPDANVRPPHW